MKRIWHFSLTILLPFLASCLGTSSLAPPDESTTQDRQGGVDDKPGVRIRFDAVDFYGLDEPEPESGCAGEARYYRDSFSHELDSRGFGRSERLPLHPSENRSLKPSFIRRVAVDLTDANSQHPLNASLACSYGTSSTSVRTSSCASFSTGSLGGVPATLQGTLLMLGGVASTNTSSSLACGATAQTLSTWITNVCSSEMVALGVDRLSSEQAGTSQAPGLLAGSVREKISAWSRLLDSGSSEVPRGVAGATASYDESSGLIYLVGGSRHFDPVRPDLGGSDTLETWTFEVGTQKWKKHEAKSQQNTSITEVLDGAPANGGSTASLVPAAQYQSQLPGGRALHGLVSVPRSALSNLSTNGVLDLTKVDTTERIFTIGGFDGNGIRRDTYRFNPTFGPEIMDTALPLVSSAGEPVQWAHSYPSTLLRNRNQTLYSASGNSPSAHDWIPNFNMDSTKTAGINFGASSLLYGALRLGSIALMGGFDLSTQLSALTCSTSGAANRCGGLFYFGRNTTETGVFQMISNLRSGAHYRPISWSAAVENTAAANRLIQWRGGMSVLPGLNRVQNDLVFFGGTNCRDYLTENSLATCSAADFSHPGGIFQLGSHFTQTPAANPYTPFPAAPPTPMRAGMASARGRDTSGNLMIVAWGGMTGPGMPGSASTLFVLPLASGNWSSCSPTAMGSPPKALTNSQMIYSHVTGKFYLFGGYEAAPARSSTSETWELSVQGDCSAGCGGAGCTFNWRPLNASTGLTCYPECPGARRSHRMIEVSYHNSDPAEENAWSARCTANAPCSYGIFMEGGTQNGVTVLNDRWLFDPTSNAGSGHWQRVDDFPPRHFAAMASLEYQPTDQLRPARRVVLFGGETGFSSSPQAQISGGNQKFFIAPTLGDTFVLDQEKMTWNRVEILGKGYAGSPSAIVFGSEWERRQAFPAGGAGQVDLDGGVVDALRELEQKSLSPPALSGAMMVSRTYSGPKSSAIQRRRLKLPEIYLLGGRLKDARFHSMLDVYKLCLGSTGERPSGPVDPYDEANCDHYDETRNPDSTGPTHRYVGRWLRKPQITLTTAGPAVPPVLHSYLGAAAYDSDRDRVVVYGGKTGSVNDQDRVTDSGVTTVNPAGVFYEYTPPSRSYSGAAASLRSGLWTLVGLCDGSDTPSTGRYGHSMGYDSSGQNLVIAGGYGPTGDLLTQTLIDRFGTRSSIPDTWTATRVSSAVEAPDGFSLDAAQVFPCYVMKRKQVFGNTPAVQTLRPPATGLAHSASVLIPAKAHLSGYYQLEDSACVGVGPLSTGDSYLSKLYAGGAYFELDRSALDKDESLILHLAYLPGNQTHPEITGHDSERAIFRIHLIRSQSDISLARILQPRFLQTYDPIRFPQVVKTLHVLPHHHGQYVEEQVVLPLPIDPRIDQVRVERVSGSAKLIEAGLFRTRRRR